MSPLPSYMHVWLYKRANVVMLALLYFIKFRMEDNMAKQQEKQRKFNLVKYVYGQLYKNYLESGKAKMFKVHNIKAQTWYYVLKKLQTEKKIESFEMGNTEDTALDVIITGFDGEDLWYKHYINAIEKNMEVA